MEDIIRLALQQYNSFCAQAALVGKQEKSLKTEEQLQCVRMAALRVEMIQNWLMLLNDDERFAVEHHLIKGLEWPRVVHAFGKRWDDLFFRSDRQMGSYQASAIAKIVSYCQKYQGIIHWLFGELAQSDPHEADGTDTLKSVDKVT